jgi:hypothetical protein
MLDCLTGAGVIRSHRLEEVEHMFRARGRPESEEVVIRVAEGASAADRHEAAIAILRKNHISEIARMGGPDARVEDTPSGAASTG